MKAQRAHCTYCARRLNVAALEIGARGVLVCPCDEVLGREEDIVERGDGRIVFDGGRSSKPQRDLKVKRAGRERGHVGASRDRPRESAIGGDATIQFASGDPRFAIALFVATGVMVLLLGLTWLMLGADPKRLEPLLFLVALFGIPFGLAAAAMMPRRSRLSIRGRRGALKEGGLPAFFRPAKPFEVSDVAQVNCRRITQPFAVDGGEMVRGAQSGTEVAYVVIAVQTSMSLVLGTFHDPDRALSVARAVRMSLGFEPGYSMGEAAMSHRRAHGHEGAPAGTRPRKQKGVRVRDAQHPSSADEVEHEQTLEASAKRSR